MVRTSLAIRSVCVVALLAFSLISWRAQSQSPSYGATARVAEQQQVQEEVGIAPADVPGTFGDPFRVMESLPGAAPMVSGLPYVYMRGAPPSGNAYVYDDIPLPQLYHLGLGPAVIHPYMLGPLQFEPGVSTARYGRRLGALLSAGAPSEPAESRVRLEARLLDANAYVALPGQDTSWMVAGRFGYPGLLTPALGIELSFSYWDYQSRFRQRLSASDEVEVIVLGSRDELDDAQAVGASIGYDDEDEPQIMQLEFHRVEARLTRRTRVLSAGMALRVGYDSSQIGSEVSARAVTVASRAYLRTRLAGGHRLDVGVDMLGAFGRVQAVPRAAAFAPWTQQAVARNTAAAYVDGDLRLTEGVRLALGGRADLWLVGGELSASADPRLRIRTFPGESLELFAGVGLLHQPVVFAFPLPGFTDVALDRGLQRALQSEVGMRLVLPWDVEVETHLFFHTYSDLLLPEIYLRALGDDSQRVSARSYGGELFITRAGHHALSGFVSYTLGFARAIEPFEKRSFSPEFDIRHVLNLVLQWRIGGGFVASSALRLRSGKPANQFTDQGVPPYYSLRLPGFFRIDSRLSYEFTVGSVDAAVYVEMLNMTLAREVVDAECFFGNCEPVAERPIWFPNLGVRGEL